MSPLATLQVGREWEEKAMKYLEVEGFVNVEKVPDPFCAYDLTAIKDGQRCLIEVRSRSPDAKTQFFVVRNTKIQHIEEAAKLQNALVFFVFVNKWGFKLLPLDELKKDKLPDVKFVEYHYKKESSPGLVRSYKIYGKGRIQIPSTALKAWNIKDGDKLRWVQLSPGTFAVTPYRDSGYRSFVP